MGMMADLATHSLNYSLENDQLSPFVGNMFDIDEGVFCDFTSPNNSPFYQERDDCEDQILNSYDALHWPELGKHITNESKLRNGGCLKESVNFLDQERMFAVADEETQSIKIDSDGDAKPETYAAVLQKTLKLKLENNNSHRLNRSHVSKNENGMILYGSGRDNNNVALVFGDQKYIFKWNFIDIPTQNVPETFDRKEVEYLTQIYCNFMRSAFEKLPVCPRGKEVVEFSSLLMLVGSRIEVHDVDGVSQLYYCLNKGWTEEDSVVAHKSYLSPYCFMREYEGVEGDEDEECEEDDDDEEILTAKAQAVCTYGFDLNTALAISKDLWDWKRPRMAYTQMFNIE